MGSFFSGVFSICICDGGLGGLEILTTSFLPTGDITSVLTSVLKSFDCIPMDDDDGETFTFFTGVSGNFTISMKLLTGLVRFELYIGLDMGLF